MAPAEPALESGEPVVAVTPAHRRGQPHRTVLNGARGALRVTPIRDLIRTRTQSSAFAACLTRRSAACLISLDGTSPMTRMVTGEPIQSGTRTIAVRGHT